MVEVINIFVGFLNNLHDLIVDIAKVLGLKVTDKGLHFWFIGILGIFIFFITNALFKKLAKWSISAISFVYTFTVLVIIVLGLEIEQKITGRGNMEFADIVAGLWGFLAFFSIYLIIRFVIYLIKRLLNIN